MCRLMQLCMDGNELVLFPDKCLSNMPHEYCVQWMYKKLWLSFNGNIMY